MTEQVWWAAGARLPIVMCIVNNAMAAPWNVLNDNRLDVRDKLNPALLPRQPGNPGHHPAGLPNCRAPQRARDGVLRRLPAVAHRDARQVPTAEQADAFLPPRPQPLQVVDQDPQHRPVTLADPRPDASGTMRPGYMELRALHHRAVLDALPVVDEVDAEYAVVTGRSWGGVVWDYLLDDADVAVIAAGSLTTQLTLAVDELRADGVRVGVLGIRCYRPFPIDALRAPENKQLAIVFDKALSYGVEAPSQAT